MFRKSRGLKHEYGVENSGIDQHQIYKKLD